MPNGKHIKHILKRVYNHESLAGIDLRNLYFSFMDFSGLDLRTANLEGCCLSHALLDDCDLTDANLANAKLTHASLNRAKMTGAILTNVVANAASFAGVTGLTPATKAYLKSKGAKGLDDNVSAASESDERSLSIK
jgi:uncharacterized protein YjbI with pentapeptide repeats